MLKWHGIEKPARKIGRSSPPEFDNMKGDRIPQKSRGDF
jgi:hypothetical protein